MDILTCIFRVESFLLVQKILTGHINMDIEWKKFFIFKKNFFYTNCIYLICISIGDSFYFAKILIRYMNIDILGKNFFMYKKKDFSYYLDILICISRGESSLLWKKILIGYMNIDI